MDDDVIKKYKDLVLSKDESYDNIISAIDVAKKFISINHRIVVGGQAIDYALKMKGHKGLYADNAVPDWDIISSTYYQDAYAMGINLSKKNFKGISIINALHPSTFKVRLDFQEVCDLTYVPKNILDAIPTLNYKNYTIVHPHFQMIDIHRALSYPYENPPMEVINRRPEKDMKRYDLLYTYYPMRVLYTVNLRVDLKDYSYDLSIIKNQCISGFIAINYWISEAEKLGFKTEESIARVELGSISLGSINFKNGKISGKMPVESNGLVLYTNNIAELYNLIGQKQNAKFYQRILDKLPRRVELQNYELIDLDQKLAAHEVKETNTHMANIQSIMLYLLVQYIIIQKMSGKHRSYSYYAGYLMCRELISWAAAEYSQSSDVTFERFLPTASVYGDRNLSDSYIVSKHNFDIKNNTIPLIEKDKYTQPSNIFDRNLMYGKIKKTYYEFDVNKSEIFNFAGNEIDNFLI